MLQRIQLTHLQPARSFLRHLPAQIMEQSGLEKELYSGTVWWKMQQTLMQN